MDSFDLNRPHNETEHPDLPPWMRPAEPDHPLMLEGDVVHGDTALMFRCFVEEYLMGGFAPELILEMCNDPGYQAFHAALLTLGRDRAKAIIDDSVARVGRHRVRLVESATEAKQAELTIHAPSTKCR
jgi:hypothetical protein